MSDSGWMARRTPCQLYDEGGSFLNLRLDAGKYWAAVQADPLPRPHGAESFQVRAGYAVSVFGMWTFFTAIEPAVTFGRAARMSTDCHGYGIYCASNEVTYCARHHRDERILHVGGGPIDRRAGEAAILERFAAGVDQGSSHWQGLVASTSRGWTR